MSFRKITYKQSPQNFDSVLVTTESVKKAVPDQDRTFFDPVRTSFSPVDETVLLNFCVDSGYLIPFSAHQSAYFSYKIVFGIELSFGASFKHSRTYAYPLEFSVLYFSACAFVESVS